ncbi:hypothetical protein F2Q70_00016582 [Brassica cretica]|uniref:Uncharacterized protein n=1 Tax=Brassica cretica TaxID=69181 RepID=A0A8S9L113_BRACR|nr:hypothetical protein F2Q70_00016582 [Brassica cretica]KAF2600375.1 hypothetical protein F2Q68_00009542 [Brassica cretica]
MAGGKKNKRGGKPKKKEKQADDDVEFVCSLETGEQHVTVPEEGEQHVTEPQEDEQHADQNNSAEVRLPSRANQDDRAVTRSSQPSRQAKANSRARLDLDREVSQNDRDFSLLVRLARTKCPKDQTDGLSLMSDTLLGFYHSDFSKARIIQLSEDLGRISTLLDHPTDCPDRPAFVQLLTATTPTWPDESGHQPKKHFDQI